MSKKTKKLTPKATAASKAPTPVAPEKKAVKANPAKAGRPARATRTAAETAERTAAKETAAAERASAAAEHPARDIPAGKLTAGHVATHRVRCVCLCFSSDQAERLAKRLEGFFPASEVAVESVTREPLALTPAEIVGAIDKLPPAESEALRAKLTPPPMPEIVRPLPAAAGAADSSAPAPAPETAQPKGPTFDPALEYAQCKESGGIVLVMVRGENNVFVRELLAKTPTDNPVPTDFFKENYRPVSAKEMIKHGFVPVEAKPAPAAEGEIGEAAPAPDADADKKSAHKRQR